jgi:hydrogenase maturation factor
MAAREITAAAGNLGATIDQAAVPVFPETQVIAAALELDPLGMLGSGSLLVASAPDAADTMIAAGAATGLLVTEIGTVIGGTSRVTIRRNGSRTPMPRFATDEVSRALNHFRTGRTTDE